MEIVYKKTSELKPYKNNPRNNRDAVDYVAASIRDFGFRNPIIIDKNNEIVAGHTRLKAAKKLHLKEVPCIMADDLTPEQVKAFRLAKQKRNTSRTRKTRSLQSRTFKTLSTRNSPGAGNMIFPS